MQLLHSSYTYFYEEKREVMGKTFGNINKTPLGEIWNSEEYSMFRDKVRNFDFPDCTICDGCDDRLKNNKDCMYNEFPTCGACLWAQGIGRCP
jgi:MoaA/NifB/PqqE/SkfB family radical SAM enzyme